MTHNQLKEQFDSGVSMGDKVITLLKGNVAELKLMNHQLKVENSKLHDTLKRLWHRVKEQDDEKINDLLSDYIMEHG